VAKAAIGNGSRDFTINNSGVYGPTVEFIVYDAAAGGAVINGVTASLSGSTLTLTKSGADEKGMAERRYYLSAQYASNDESNSRLMLRVLPPVVNGYALFFSGDANVLTNVPGTVSLNEATLTGSPTIGTGHDGSNAAVTFATGKYIKLENTAGNFNWSGSFTVAFWVRVNSVVDQMPFFGNMNKPNTTADRKNAFVMWWRGTNITGSNQDNGLHFRSYNSTGSTGHPYAQVAFTGTSLGSRYPAELSLEYQQWHHLAIVYASDGSKYHVTGYYDGALTTAINGDTSTADLPGGNYAAYIAHNGEKDDTPFSMQDFILTEGAYTAEQIAALAAQ
jgi:hypothetical protein